MCSPPIFFILPTPLSPVLRFFFLLPRRTLSSPPPSCRARSGAARHSVVPRPSPEELPREEVRRAPVVSSQGATAPPTARPAARRCRARRSGAPPPRRSEELPRPPTPRPAARSCCARRFGMPPPRRREELLRPRRRCVFGSSDPPAGSSAPRPACYPAALRTLSGTPPALVRLLFISFY